MTLSDVLRWIRRRRRCSFAVLRNGASAACVLIDETRNTVDCPDKSINRVRGVAAVEDIQVWPPRPESHPAWLLPDWFFVKSNRTARSGWWLVGSSSGSSRPSCSFMASSNFITSCACFSPSSSHATAKRGCTFLMRPWFTVCENYTLNFDWWNDFIESGTASLALAAFSRKSRFASVKFFNMIDLYI